MKTSLRDALTDVTHRMQRNGELAGACTGYTKIDNAIDGWQREQVYVVGGRSGIGKSVFGLNVAMRFADRGLGVDFITLEMPIGQQALRAMFCKSGVESHRLKFGTMRPTDFADMVQANRHMCDWTWAWNPKSTLNIEGIREHIQRVKAHFASKGKELHAVFIDHVLNIKGSNLRQPRREQLIHITQQLKSIAKDEHVCMVALTQLNRSLEQRGVKDKRPRISDLKESGSFEEDSDVVMLLYRADRYEKNRERWNYEFEVSLPKIRGGEDGVCSILKFDGPRYRIDNNETDTGSDTDPNR